MQIGQPEVIPTLTKDIEGLTAGEREQITSAI
jgi:hypothetical protein